MKWPTEEEIEELVVSEEMTRSEKARVILGRFEPFRMVEIRGFLGTYAVSAEEFLSAAEEGSDDCGDGKLS